jgi:integrase
VATVRVRKRKDGSTYSQVRYRLDGVESSASFNDHAEALQFCDLANRLGPAKALDVWRVEQHHVAGMTVEHWINHYIDHLTGVAKSTIYDYRSYLRKNIAPALGAIPLAALTSDDIAEWVQDMADDGASGKTIANKHGFLSAALAAAVARKPPLIASNPAAGHRLPTTERRAKVFLTREEFALLRNNVTEYWRPLVEFLVVSGARFGEVSALRPSDVDRDAGTVTIGRAWKRTYTKDSPWESGAPKTRKSVRTIDVDKSVLDKLDYSGDWLFTTPGQGGRWKAGAPVRRPNFRANVWVPAVDRAQAAGLKKSPRIHDLRHTCASWLIAARTPLPVVQDHLGHESIETTVHVYGSLDRKLHRAAAAALADALD